MNKQHISGNVVGIRPRIKGNRLHLENVDEHERASVESVAMAILKWPGMTNEIDITGINGDNGFTTLYIKGFNQFTSLVDWCKEFHNNSKPEYNLVTDTQFVGELQVHIRKVERPVSSSAATAAAAANGKYTERLKKVRGRISIQDADSGSNSSNSDDEYESGRSRAYIPK